MREKTGVSKMPRRIYSPIPTMMMLRKNGMRHPQVKNSSPERQLKNNTAMFARNRPARAPNCGHEATKPR
jgi:hypothetical protein